MELSEHEKEIITILRELKPYERVDIQKDKGGEPDVYFVVRTQKIVINSVKNSCTKP